MSKILLVEDDNNLREIYEARLKAEGYEIVSAHDGEEALVIAKAEKPDLVISDVMMPKISGFEMLDILRNTEGLQGMKVIMLTALGQSDDQHRAEKLGADRYLVKSQVTLEDIVIAANELLTGAQAAGPDITSVGGQISTAAPAEPAASVSTTPAPAQDTVTTSEPPATPAAEIPPAAAPTPMATPPEPTLSPVVSAVSEPPKSSIPAADMPSGGLPAESVNQEENEVQSQINGFMNGQPQTGQGTAMATPAADNAPPTPAPVAGMRVIEPLPSTETKTDINQLLQMSDNDNVDKPSGMVMTPQSDSVTPASVVSPNPAQDSGADPESIAL